MRRQLDFPSNVADHALMPTASTSSAEVINSKQLLKIVTALRRGDFSIRMPVDLVGIEGKISDTLNEVIELNEKMTTEFERISRAVGKEGR